MKINDDWDDWDDFDDLDDFDEAGRVQEPEPEGLLTTRRIVVGVVLLAVAAIIIGRMVVHEKPQMAEVPESLIGLWTCEDAAKSDLYVEFGTDFVMFGTGGTGSVKHSVQGSDVEPVGDLRQYSIYYRDMAGTRHIKDLLLEANGQNIRFTDDPQVRYSKFSQ